MKKSLYVLSIALAAICGAILGPMIQTKVMAQSASNFASCTLYAGPRKDTENDESFIFFDTKTGDLWVYHNEDFDSHYKVSTLGQKLEKINK